MSERKFEREQPNGNFLRQTSEDGERENKNSNRIVLKIPFPQPSNSAGGSAIGSPSTLDKKTRNRIERLERRQDLRNYTDQNYPLSLLLQKFTSGSKAELKELITILNSSNSTTKRKEDTYKFILNNRRRIGKLAATARWAKDVNDVQAAHNINTTLIHQNRQYDEVVRFISEIHKNVGKARVRKYSLTTALDVLTAGEIQGIPSIIEDYFVREPLSQDQVDRTLEVTDDYIFLRFIKTEMVPDSIRRNALIENGKLVLTFVGEYQITLTLLQPDMILPWHVVSINLFIGEEGLDTEDGKLYYLNGDQYFNLIELVQQSLLPVHLRLIQPPGTVFPPDPPASYHYDGPPVKSQALVNMHNFLHSFCLQAQLEMLYTQAYRMALFGWNGNLRTYRDHNTESLKLMYWSRRLPMIFKLDTTVKVKQPAQHLTIIKTSGPDACLTLDWGGFAVTSLLEACSDEDLDTITFAEKDFTICSTSLNVEKLMRQAIRLHSKLILFKLRDLTLNPVSEKITKHLCFPIQPEDIVFDNSEIPSLTIKMSEHLKLRLVVQFRSGFIKPSFENRGNFEGVDAEFERRVNDEPIHIGLIIQHWKLRHIVNNFKQVAYASRLGFQHSLRLEKFDTVKFGTILHYMLYIEVPGARNCFFVVGIVDHSLHFWYITISVSAVYTHAITSLVELDDVVSKLIHRSYVGGPEISMERTIDILNDLPNTDLVDRLMNLCQGYCIVTSIETQLVKRRCPYSKFGIFGEQPATPSFVPKYLKAFDPPPLPGPDGTFIHKSVSRIFSFQHKSFHRPASFLQNKVAVYGHPTVTTWVAFTCAIDPSYPLVPTIRKYIADGNQNLPKTWLLSQEPITEVDGADEKLLFTFVYYEFTDCYQQFSEDYLIVQRVAKLYLIASRLNLGVYGMELCDYDLQSFTIKYNNVYSFKIGFCRSAIPSHSGTLGLYKLNLQFYSDEKDGRRNPHLLIEHFLKDIFVKKPLEDLIVAIGTTFNVVEALDNFHGKTTGGAIVLTHSATRFRIVFSSSQAIDISIIDANQIIIEDACSSVDSNIPVVEPFMPEVEPKVNSDPPDSSEDEEEDDDLERALQKEARLQEKMELENKKPVKRIKYTEEQLKGVIVTTIEGYNEEEDPDYIAEQEEKAKLLLEPVPNPYHLKLQPIPYFKHFALNFQSLIYRVRGLDPLINGPLVIKPGGVICSSSWTLVALRAFEWVQNLFTWFPRIHAFANQPQEPEQKVPEKQFSELADLVVPFHFPSCTLTLCASEDFCHFRLEPTSILNPNLLDMESARLLCNFFTRKIDAFGTQSFETLKSICSLFTAPEPVLSDLIAAVRLVERSRQLNSERTLEWLLTMPPHNSQKFPGFPRPLVPVFTKQEDTFKVLFAVKCLIGGQGKSILVPITFNHQTRNFGVWEGSYGETDEPISSAQFQPLKDWLLSIQSSLGDRPFTAITNLLLSMDTATLASLNNTV